MKESYSLPLVLLVIEDLHWADPSTLELIGLWLSETPGSATVTLLTARREFEAPWKPQDNIATLDLGRLPEGDAHELVRLAGGRARAQR